MKVSKGIMVMAVLLAAAQWVCATPVQNVVVGNTGGAVYDRSSSDLSGLFSGSGYGTISAVATQANGRVIVGNTAGTVYAFAANNFSTALYSYSGFGTITDIAVQHDGDVIVANSIGTLYRRAAADLSNVAFKTGYGSVTSLGVLSNDTIVVGRTDGYAHLANADTLISSATQAGFTTGVGGVMSIAVKSNDQIVIASKDALYIRNTNLTTGIATKTGYADIVDLGILPNGDIAVGRANGVHASLGSTGASYAYKTIATGAGIVSIDVLANGNLVVGRNSGWMHTMAVSGTTFNYVSSASGLGTIREVAVQIPEPATMALLGLGGLLFARKK